MRDLFSKLPAVPDILVNNAGVQKSSKSLVDSNTDDWWSDFVCISRKLQPDTDD